MPDGEVDIIKCLETCRMILDKKTVGLFGGGFLAIPAPFHMQFLEAFKKIEEALTKEEDGS